MILGVFIRLYYDVKESHKSQDIPKISDLLSPIINVMESEQVSVPSVKSLQPSRILTKISSIKSKTQSCRPFMVADIETILVNDVHVPYAAGYLQSR